MTESVVNVTDVTKEQFFEQLKAMIEQAKEFDGHMFIGIMLLTAEDENGEPVELDENGEATMRTRIIHNAGDFNSGLLMMNNIAAQTFMKNTSDPQQQSYTVQ